MAGSVGKPLEPGTAARIFTGAPMPPGADAVVIQEETEVQGEFVSLKKKASPGDWVRYVGGDIRKGSEILPAGKRLAPQDTGLAASVGIKTLPVYRKVRLGLFFTGDELVMPGEPLAPGRIYNSNRFTLRGLAQRVRLRGARLRHRPGQPRGDARGAAPGAQECDLIVTSGGVSVGEADYVKPAVEAEGRLLMWRIAMKPGRPLAFGRIGDAAFIGLPGNPGLELRHLPDLRASVSPAHPGPPARGTEGHRGARRFRLARTRCAAGIPAREMECAGWP
jgi:molybdopterin molybdotransferase